MFLWIHCVYQYHMHKDMDKILKVFVVVDSTLHTQCGSPITGLPKRRVYEMHIPPRGDVG